MIPGTVYGIVLNDRQEHKALTPDFRGKPYDAPPQAAVVHIKPRACVTTNGAPVPLSGDTPDVVAAATVMLLFGDRPGIPAAAALALDVFEPHADYYRPAIRQRCCDGFLPIGRFAPYDSTAIDRAELVTTFDDGVVHRWSMGRLVRSASELIAHLGTYMTLADGDALLVGIAGDAPRAKIGTVVEVTGGGLPALHTHFAAEQYT